MIPKTTALYVSGKGFVEAPLSRCPIDIGSPRYGATLFVHQEDERHFMLVTDRGDLVSWKSPGEDLYALRVWSFKC